MKKEISMDDELRVVEIAEAFGVTRRAVYYWIQKGLKTKMNSAIGKKDYMTIRVGDVYSFKNIKIRSLNNKGDR